MEEVKDDRIAITGIAAVTLGLLIYGWFAVRMDRSLLPAEGWILSDYLLITLGLTIIVWRSVKQRRLSYNFALLGGCMFLVSLFTALLYCNVYGIRVPGPITATMDRLLEIGAPIAPFIWMLYVGGLALLILQAVYTVLRRVL